MKVGIPKEIYPGERRVAGTPQTAKRLQKQGFEVLVQSGAGATADFSDAAYEEVGCTVLPDAASLWAQADLVLKVRAPSDEEIAGMKEGQHLISFIWPAQNPELLEKLQAKKATVIAMDMIPRISRAQKCDALSSMANIAGYRSIIEAAQNFGSFFTGQMTAAGKVPPAKVLVIGGGVAGLAAVGAARGLGAQVKAFDTRPAVKEQVESLGGEFLTLEFEEDGAGAGGYAKVMTEAFMDAERALFEEEAKNVDIIVTTALIPGKPAPLLLTEQAVQNMKEGSVIVDLAAERGGNCPLAQPNEIVEAHGVRIIGYTDLPSRMPTVSSNLYGNNLCHLLDDMGKAEEYGIDEDDDVVRGALVVRDGELKYPPPKPKVEAQNKAPTPPPEPAPVKKAAPEKTEPSWMPLLIGGIALIGVGWGGSASFLSHFTVFILACFVGWQVVWNVNAALHTPLMSVTNAISGIIIVGGMLQIGSDVGSPAAILGTAAILVATINIAGGFLVTQRMLKMFRR
jgi:NAD(P) transhydrogenase subunit alpha